MNLQLQGDYLNLTKTKNVISAFDSNLLLFKQNLARGEFYQFPNLCGLKKTDSILDDDVHVYCDHLNMLHKEMHERYEDILTMTMPAWILDPYSNANEIETFLQEELIELQANEELKPRFNSGYSHFCLQHQIGALYLELWKVVKKFLMPFPSSYLVEREFSAAIDLLVKKGNRLQAVQRGDLRLLLTNIEPGVEKLVLGYQPQPSH
ncbi:hypothetical protein D918_08386 [Trichuris suis]|nr:hypothetical protein D918_08386 [Trichuris suis]